LALRAASRAYSISRATTTATGWPRNSTLPSARKGSSWMIGPQLFSPGNVGGREHRHHTVLAQDGLAVDALAEQFAMGHRRQDQRGVQGAAQFGDVVGVDRLAGHVQAADS
jgi:hypothetical protein